MNVEDLITLVELEAKDVVLAARANVKRKYIEKVGTTIGNHAVSNRIVQLRKHLQELSTLIQYGSQNIDSIAKGDGK